MLLPYRIREQIRITALYSMFITDYESGYTFSGETHDFWECVYIMRGEVCVSANERIYNLGEGEIIFHKPLELHKFEVTGSEGAKLFIFSFSCEGEAVDFFKNKVFLLSKRQQNTIDALLDYINEKCGLESDETDIWHYLRPFEKRRAYSQTICVYLYQLFLSLCDDDNMPSDVSDAPDALLFRKAVDYMKRSAELPLSVEQTADYCNVSKTTLKRIFRKFSGLGVHKYFIKLKINAAAQMLKSGKSVSQTAEQLGFGESGYFSYVFKRETGTSPSEFRNKYERGEAVINENDKLDTVI